MLIAAAASHLKPLLTFLLCTGARLSEAVYLEWRDVDLIGARAIFWPDRTKSKRRRNVHLPPRIIAALANLPHRDGMVFRRPGWTSLRGPQEANTAGRLNRLGEEQDRTARA